MDCKWLVRCSCSVIALLVAVSAASADGGGAKEEKIKRAMSAAPAFIAEKATIMDVDGTVLRAGTNGWTCMPSLTPEDKVPMCNDEVWMDFMHAFMNKGEFKPKRVGISYMFGGDVPTNNDDPFDTTQDPGEPWVTEGPHLMIIIPDKAALEGITNDPNAGGPYVMYKGTPWAHIMIPTAPRKP